MTKKNKRLKQEKKLKEKAKDMEHGDFVKNAIIKKRNRNETI